MFRLEHLTCPGCGTALEIGIADETIVVCPGCGQRNMVPEGGQHIEGLCDRPTCRQPIDAHRLDAKGNIIGCP